MSPVDYWLSATEVCGRLTVSRPAIYRWIAEGTFPRPARFSSHCVRWRTSWITEWEATRQGVAEHPRTNAVALVEAVARPPARPAPVVGLPTASTRQPPFRRHAWEPLTMTWAEVADRVFRRDAAWLHRNLPPDFPRLPRPDPEYHLFHVEAVEAWARRRWHVVSDPGGDEQARATAQAILRERLRACRDTRAQDAGGETAPTRWPRKRGAP